MDGSSEPTARTQTRASPQGRVRTGVLLLLPICAIGAFAWYALSPHRYQETDNAYVQASRTAVSSSLSARVISVHVRENQSVRKGDLLISLDDASFRADLAQAEAQLAAAGERIQALREDYRLKSLAVSAAEERVTYARAEKVRADALGAEGLASRQKMESADHAVSEASAALASARQAVTAARANGGDPAVPIDRQPLVLEAGARVERARIAVANTQILAPADGVVTRVEQVQAGSFVNPGQSLFWLLSGTPWVEANFKEDQIARMRAGQSAEIRLDALGDEPLAARIASFSPGTGAVFAALPAQNASGNWVKVVQRVPVRLEFVNPPADARLTAGLSAHVKVDTAGMGESP
jgi:membrane fusion protein (multidrug efflux system)